MVLIDYIFPWLQLNERHTYPPIYRLKEIQHRRCPIALMVRYSSLSKNSKENSRASLLIRSLRAIDVLNQHTMHFQGWIVRPKEKKLMMSWSELSLLCFVTQVGPDLRLTFIK